MLDFGKMAQDGSVIGAVAGYSWHSMKGYRGIRFSNLAVYLECIAFQLPF